MKGTFEFELKDGRKCRIEAEYECIMENETLDAEGWKLVGKAKPTTTGRTNMVLYIDDKKCDSSWDSNFWQLIDVKNGIKKIWGLPIVFSNLKEARAVACWDY